MNGRDWVVAEADMAAWALLRKLPNQPDFIIIGESVQRTAIQMPGHTGIKFVAFATPDPEWWIENTKAACELMGVKP